MRVVEVIIRLLRELIQHGWKARASPQLFQQLLAFMALIIGGVPNQPKQTMPEEAMIEGFRTLAALISIAEPSHLVPPAASASEGKTISALFCSVEVMLDGVTESVVSSVQLEAVQGLRAVFTTIRDNKILAQFLPGTVSALTKVLAPPQANHTTKRVLINCLEVLKLVLTNVLGDIKVRSILKKLESSGGTDSDAPRKPENSGSQAELTPSWLKATASQVKLALSAVLKLRTHDAEEVQSSLHRLCVSLLDECHASLVDCQSILVETSMMLEDSDAAKPHFETNLQDLAGVYPELGDSIKSALYNWITGLPRVMQSNDDRVKQLAIKSILRGSKLAAAMQMDSSTLQDALGDSLRDSIITLVKGSKQPRIMDDTGADISASTDLARPGMELATYTPVLLDSEGQKTTRAEVGSLISSIGSATQQVKLATFMLGYVRDSEGVDQIASFWLAFELLKVTYAQSSEMDDLLDLSSLGESRDQEDAFRELYDFSASVLTAHSDSIEADWRLEAIALEVTAFAASRLKIDFRPELIDVLYPVTTFLGSQLPQLRKHAITTLNIIAISCGYESVSDLIVDNADYMVNSISLRLNTFDISPASAKVLTMVIRLTGPRLIPFLDDVVAAVFAALDNYHGYPIFVETLFSVLSEVVTQGVKSDMLLLEDANSKPINHRKTPPQPLGIPSILDTLQTRLDRAARSQAEPPIPIEPHPKRPWAPPKQDQAKSLLDKLTNPEDDSEPDDQPTAADDDTQQPVDKPKTPTYTLLTRVLSLTQHYLTSPTPTLRRSLLALIATVTPALAPDEGAFLPLVHAVWPVVLGRLRDPEPYVVVAACEALAGLCKGAGDFLSTRFKSEWWGGGEAALGRWARRVKREAGVGGVVGKVGGRRGAVAGAVRGKDREDEGILIPVRDGEEGVGEVRVVQSSAGGASLGRFAQAAQVWEAVVGLLTAIVGYVRIEDEMFDDILGLVVDVLPRYGELRQALETVNADAVWLAMYERGMVGGMEAPAVEGFEFQFVKVEGRGAVSVGV